RKNFGKALAAAGLSGFRLYDLRHTFASLLLAQRAPITYVAAQLGHSRPTTTLQWYAHWIPGGRERYVDSLAGPAGTSKGRGKDARVPASGHRWGTKSSSGAPDESEAPEKIGGPSRTRTLDPLIKSCPEPSIQDTSVDLSPPNQSKPQ